MYTSEPARIFVNIYPPVLPKPALFPANASTLSTPPETSPCNSCMIVDEKWKLFSADSTRGSVI